MSHRLALGLVFAVTLISAVMFSPVLDWARHDPADSTPEMANGRSEETGGDPKYLKPIDTEIAAFEDKVARLRADAEESEPMASTSTALWEAAKPSKPTPAAAMSRLLFTLHTTTAAHLAYNEEFNPRQKPFTDAQWKAYHRMMAPYQDHLRLVSGEMHRKLAEEVRALATSNVLRAELTEEELSAKCAEKATRLAQFMNAAKGGTGHQDEVRPSDLYARLLRSAHHDPTKVGFSEHVIGGQTYYYDPMLSKSYRAMLEYYCFRSQELTLALVAWLESNGFLTPQEASALRIKAIDMVQAL